MDWGEGGGAEGTRAWLNAWSRGRMCEIHGSDAARSAAVTAVKTAMLRRKKVMPSDLVSHHSASGTSTHASTRTSARRRRLMGNTARRRRRESGVCTAAAAASPSCWSPPAPPLLLLLLCCRVGVGGFSVYAFPTRSTKYGQSWQGYMRERERVRACV